MSAVPGAAPEGESGDLGKREAELIAARRASLAALRERGHDPFRETRYDADAHAAELVARFTDLPAGGEPTAKRFSLAGRLLAIRRGGKLTFADLHDRTGRLQLQLRIDVVGEAPFRTFDLLDRGDIVGVRGPLLRTRRGELTLLVESFRVLAKDLIPLPDKWHGLVDVEKRYRQRYVDLIVNAQVRDTFVLRSRIVAEMRRFIDSRGFLEVETPTMLNIAGGAAARPFRTHHHALDIPLDLRIATELNLKRLVVGGLERVYEIGRIFRNEGIDTRHNPEFTMLELYAAYWSVAEMMEFNEELFAHLAALVSPDLTLRFGEEIISFARPFGRIRYFEAFERFGGVTRAELLDLRRIGALERRFGLPPAPSHAHALDKLFERVVEPHLVQPTFVHDQPLLLSPLAKRKPDDPELVDRYELFAAHMELANAFTELNDPDDQRRRFEAQLEERARGDEDVPEPDWDFVRALEYGMPPTAGIGVGVDRLVMLYANEASIRDVILFPLQRPL